MVITSPWALHVGVPDRVNRPTSIGLGVTADNTSLTFTAVDVTFSGSSANAVFAGIDTKNVEYVASDRGRVAGINIPYIANQLNGTFTGSEQGSFSLTGDTAQCSQPSFEIAGTVTFDTPCDPAQSSPH